MVVLRVQDYWRDGPDTYQHRVIEKVALVVSINDDGTANVLELKPTHIGVKHDPDGIETHAFRSIQENDRFEQYGYRIKKE